MENNCQYLFETSWGREGAPVPERCPPRFNRFVRATLVVLNLSLENQNRGPHSGRQRKYKMQGCWAGGLG